MLPRILIIEDEKSIAETIIYALNNDGFAPEWCGTGAEGLRMVSEGAFSLVVLDIGLPDVSGLELCKRIRAESSVPVLFLSARAEEIDKVVGLEIGGDDYMVKPFSPRELAARIRAVLRRSGQTPPAFQPSPAEPPPAGGPFTVDPDRKCISYFGTQLDLPRQEYRILLTLISRPGRVYSRDELMNAAWDDPGFSTDRTVDTHIKTLRAKLRSAGPSIADPIETHRGFGYSLKELPA
jgi:two-component system catabolic regulation response regulator CreB